MLTLQAEDNAVPQRMFDDTNGVRDGIQELAAGIFGDFGYCKLISHELQSQRTNYELPGIMWLFLMTCEIVGSFNPAQISCPCNPSPSYPLYIGKDKCLLRITELLIVSRFHFLLGT